MALPEDFSKIYGSTATGGLTPINDVNYAKGWEFVGSNPPTKNDFSYLQNLSDLKSQWLYSNKLQRADPFGDIKSDGTVQAARVNLGLGTAATKNVGTGSGQIPDMSSFSSGSGWQRLPSGLIIQWGSAISGLTGDAQINPFPIAFTDLGSIQIVATYDNPDAPNGPVYFAAKANTTSSFRVLNSLNNANVAYARWIAIGR